MNLAKKENYPSFPDEVVPIVRIKCLYKNYIMSELSFAKHAMTYLAGINCMSVFVARGI